MFALLGSALGIAIGAGAVLLTDPQAAELATARQRIVTLEKQAESAKVAATSAATIESPATESAAEAVVEVPVVAPSPPVRRNPIEVAAARLFKDFEDNQVAADQRYAGRLVRVTGTIESIGKDILGTPYISLLADADAFGVVQCMFDEAAGLESLSKGSRITIDGLCSGKMMNVIVRESRIVD